MAEPSQYYVDPSLGSDTGDGTLGTPWGRASGSVVQYALNTLTRDATNGDQINLKAGAADTLAADLTVGSYGTPSYTAPLIIKGYTSAKNDGGIGEIDGAATYKVSFAGSLGFFDLKIGNVGSNNVITLTSINNIVSRCEIYGSTSASGIGITIGNYSTVEGCYFHDIVYRGVTPTAHSIVQNNYFKNDSSGDFTDAIYLSSQASVIVSNNIISVDGDSNGITFAGSSLNSRCFANSVFGVAGTGTGIDYSNSNPQGSSLNNNVVEGFSGAGGVGIKVVNTPNIHQVRSNAVYNNTTNYSGLDADEFFDNQADDSGHDNEALVSSPFIKSGADTFANRFVYFSPINTGNVQGGAYVGS